MIPDMGLEFIKFVLSNLFNFSSQVNFFFQLIFQMFDQIYFRVADAFSICLFKSNFSSFIIVHLLANTEKVAIFMHLEA